MEYVDIFGQKPQVGDIIVFNPPKYKGIMAGRIIGFTKAGCPKIGEITQGVSNWTVQYEIERDGFYSLKTDFAIQRI